MATDAVGCDVDKIGKSIIFLIGAIGQVVLFITAGGRQVDRRKAEAIVGETLSKADATLILTTTGFAIGGVSPVGLHICRNYFRVRYFYNVSNRISAGFHLGSRIPYQ